MVRLAGNGRKLPFILGVLGSSVFCGGRPLRRYSAPKLSQQARGAARALRDGLGQSKIDAEISAPEADLSPNTLLIQVGSEPHHTLDETLRELGPPPAATPIIAAPGVVLNAGSNRSGIPEQFQFLIPNAQPEIR
ncbi:exported hypothetical protein [Acidobacteriia bacterium SbA2]|nr:exported hypothetical protein [Acidobacteriia bacterium SbA2]